MYFSPKHVIYSLDNHDIKRKHLHKVRNGQRLPSRAILIDGNYIYVFYVVECFVFSSNMIKFVT